MNAVIYARYSSDGQREESVDVFVNSIFLYDDKLVIAFKWKNGIKTVTLAELEAVIENNDNSNSSESVKSAVSARTFYHEFVQTVLAQQAESDPPRPNKAREAPSINDFKSSHIDDNAPAMVKDPG